MSSFYNFLNKYSLIEIILFNCLNIIKINVYLFIDLGI